ncbi:MAG: bifunctional nuclease family protein [Nitrospirota bacterium]
MDVEVLVKGVLPDPSTESQIVLLEEGGTSRTLPIWVGMVEGNAIRLAVERTAPPRPLTHDLLQHILDRLHASVKRVVVHDVRDNTFFAAIYLDVDGQEVTLDARPSDAIALALRARVPIYARRDLLATSESERVQAWLEDLKPTDFDAQ